MMKLKYFLYVFLLFLVYSKVEASDDYRLLKTFSNDDSLYVQGFEQYDGQHIVIGTGKYGSSMIGLYNIETGEYQVFDPLGEDYFGEGLTRVEDYIWQFTWREGTAFKRDFSTLKVIETVKYQGEGWGMAYDEEENVIWTSDGSHFLTKRDSKTFSEISKLSISENNRLVLNINELEFVNGAIYANIWQTNDIIKIDLETGKVMHRWNLSDLVDKLEFSTEDTNRVLNGIAHIKDNRFYITGKRYPVIWEIELIE